jgi:hypothetical protein
MVEQSKKGLVLRNVEVKRGGKTFTQKRWVKVREDELGGKKTPKKEDIEDKETYKIGEKLNFLGDKYIEIKKVSESEKTVKLSNGFVYTFEAIEAGKRGISGGDYNIGDKVKYNGKEYTITRINQLADTVELDNMGSIKIKDINKEKPKEKLKIKNLKPIKKEKEKSMKILKDEIESFIPKLKSKENGQKMLDSLQDYTVGSYFGINAYIRRGDSGEKNMDEEIKNISDLLQSAPKMTGTVYRGMKFDSNEDCNKFISELENNKIFKCEAFTSTTMDKERAMGHARSKYNNLLFEIKSKSGVFLNGMSEFPNETEVLLDKGSKFKILNIDKSNPKNIKITMEEI